MPKALGNGKVEQILREVHGGSPVIDVAKKHKVSKGAIYKHLKASSLPILGSSTATGPDRDIKKENARLRALLGEILVKEKLGASG